LCVAIYTLSALFRYIHKFMQKYNLLDIVELHQLWDWRAFFEPHSAALAGFCTSQFGPGMHEVYVRKDREGRVRVWFRASSQASSWLPEGPGHIVFSKTTPEGRPPIARAKADAAWGRAEVEGTVRSWFRFMSTSSVNELNDIKREWTERFNQLPIDGDASQLSASLMLQWQDLPLTTHVEPPACDGVGGGNVAEGVTGTLENPRVDPVSGSQRSAADIRSDLQRHQQTVRQAFANTSLPALYQADYLFIQLPGRELELHRVAHGIILDDATSADISFTTVSYHHTPQNGVQGFFGTFEMTDNPAYDPHDTRKGPMYLRHRNLTREVIRLYDVQVFTQRVKGPDGSTRTHLRVQSSSLQALAAASPSHPMPRQIPATHLNSEAPVRPSAGAAQRSAATGDAPSAGAAQRSAATGDAPVDDEGSCSVEDNGVEVGEGEQAGSESRDRVGLSMEIQGCDPDECEGGCSECPWEACTVVTDHGRACDVRICSDPPVMCLNIANRFLRLASLAAAASKRRRTAA
jgi:hypothetical protein